jgi:GDPmannose 4,6-dehydratase
VIDWRPLVTLDPDFVRPADAAEHRGDASRASSELGWQPRTEFADMVAAMVDADLASLHSTVPKGSGR